MPAHPPRPHRRACSHEMRFLGWLQTRFANATVPQGVVLHCGVLLFIRLTQTLPGLNQHLNDRAVVDA